MSQTATTTDQILELGHRWAEAERTNDVATVGSLLDDDFLCVGPLGFVIDKAQYLGPRRSGDLRHEALSWEDVRVRQYGDTAIAVGTQTQTSRFLGRDASGRFRVTQVLTRRTGDWSIASLHYSPIAPPPQE